MHVADRCCEPTRCAETGTLVFGQPGAACLPACLRASHIPLSVLPSRPGRMPCADAQLELLQSCTAAVEGRPPPAAAAAAAVDASPAAEQAGEAAAAAAFAAAAAAVAAAAEPPACPWMLGFNRSHCTTPSTAACTPASEGTALRFCRSLPAPPQPACLPPRHQLPVCQHLPCLPTTHLPALTGHPSSHSSLPSCVQLPALSQAAPRGVGGAGTGQGAALV